MRCRNITFKPNVQLSQHQDGYKIDGYSFKDIAKFFGAHDCEVHGGSDMIMYLYYEETYHAC